MDPDEDQALKLLRDVGHKPEKASPQLVTEVCLWAFERIRTLEEPDHLQRRALEVWGIETQLTKLIEEASELTAVTARWFLGTAPTIEVYEELIGTRSVLDSVELWFDRELPYEDRRQVIDDQRQKLKEALQGARGND